MDINLQIGKLGDVFLEFSGQPGKDRDVIEFCRTQFRKPFSGTFLAAKEMQMNRKNYRLYSELTEQYIKVEKNQQSIKNYN